MSTAVRWTVLAAAVVLLVGLIIWARGETHHRGDEVGALSSGSVASVVRATPGG